MADLVPTVNSSKIGDTLAAGYYAGTGDPVGTYATHLGGNEFPDAKTDFNNITNGNMATKAGLGQYHPSQPGLDETAFTNNQGLQARLGALATQQQNANTQAPPQMQAATVGPAAQLSPDQQQFRNQQQSLANALQLQANGQGPSLAGQQLAQARDQQIQTAMGLAASQRGLTAGQGLRSIADQTAQANQFAAQQSAQARIAEQLAARQQLSGVLDTARTGDINVAGQNAGLQQQTSLQQALLNQQAAANNQQASLSQTGLNDNFINALNQQMNGLTAQQQKNLMDLQAMKYGGQIQQQGIAQTSFDNRNKNIGGFLGGAGEGIASIGAMVAAA